MSGIKPKFKEGDKVYFIKDNGEVKTDEVLFCIVSINRWSNPNPHIVYGLKEDHKDRHNPYTHKESDLFKSPKTLGQAYRKRAEQLI